MKATSVLENRKYYGTIIKLDNDEAFKVWIRGENKNPSERQLKQDKFKSLKDAHNEAYYSDGHYETQSCFELCEKIVAGINKNDD